MTKDLLCGGVAGSLGVLFGVPFDSIKVRMQSFPQKFPTAFSTFTVTLREEGPLALYKGTLSPVLAQTALNGLIFAGERFAMHHLEPAGPRSASPSPLNIYLAGMFGGFVQCFALVPTDLIKCKMQIDGCGSHVQRKYSGVIDCVTKIVKEDGIFGLYRGFVVTAFREVPSFGLYFSVYRNISQGFADKKTGEPSATVTMMAGGLAGCASWASIYPLDVIKSNIQTASPSAVVGEGQKVLSAIQVAKNLRNSYGYAVFYRGFGVTILRAFPVSAITFLLYEYFTSMSSKFSVDYSKN